MLKHNIQSTEFYCIVFLQENKTDWLYITLKLRTYFEISAWNGSYVKGA